MFKYISAELFNQANLLNLQSKPFEDEWSRLIIKALLNKYSPKVKSIYEYQGNNCLDLKLTMNDKTHNGIEIKFRKEDANIYQTHLINDEKFLAICKKRDKKWIQGAFLTSIWSNGIIWVSNIFGEYEIELYLLNKTTNVSATTDYKKEWKICYCYKPEKVFYFCYEWDDELNQYIPYFSTEPINVAELNRLAEEQTKPDPLF